LRITSVARAPEIAKTAVLPTAATMHRASRLLCSLSAAAADAAAAAESMAPASVSYGLPVPPRSVVVWLVILCVATLAKKMLKPKGIPARRLQDSGECPFPFIFFHDPVAGVKKHPGKLVVCAAMWAFRESRRLRMLRPVPGL
jgi:hypothetical protein